MKLFIFSFLVFVGVSQVGARTVTEICADYISEWKKFFPTKAYSQGMHSSIFQFEDFSAKNIRSWLEFNQMTKEVLLNNSTAPGSADRINSRLLMTQIEKELDFWTNQRVHEHSLQLYTSLLSKSIESVLMADFLTIPERNELLCSRVESMSTLSQSARKNLNHVDSLKLVIGITQIKNIINAIENNTSLQSAVCANFSTKVESLVAELEKLLSYVQEDLLPSAKSTQPILGEQAYVRALQNYVDDNLHSETLAKLALKEIEDTKLLILEKSKEYLRKQYPERIQPASDSAIIAKTFSDMEKDAPKDGKEYLAFWKQLNQAAVQFLTEKDLVTLPKHETLRILSAPESAGPAARIGWVDVAPPFDPNPMTTLYLPSIPDTTGEQEKTDFWASFNKPFNRMIVIHELYPGHYMQFQIARETPHPVRLLFPYGPYIEGWATFIEVVALDAGWEAERPLTYLAHLRKRLENANRAYMSVMVHCEGWNQDQVMKFSTETSLLAPQFAKSLWGRLLRSPMQITSYYYGGVLIRELLAFEKQRLGAEFEMKTFLDIILKSGPIPIDEFYPLLEQSTPSR